MSSEPADIPNRVASCSFAKSRKVEVQMGLHAGEALLDPRVPLPVICLPL